MTNIAKRGKRAVESEQSRYENAILNDDTDLFLELCQSGKVVVNSVTAVQNATSSKKNFYLRQILEGVNNLLASTASEKSSSSSSKSIKKAKSTPPKNETVEKIVNEWPFETARVVWNDEFSTKKDEKPLTVAESKVKWQKLFNFAEQFCNNVSLQSEIFSRIEEMAYTEKPDLVANPRAEAKLQNSRQSIRLCLTRMCFVTKMLFIIAPRTAGSSAERTIDFSQLLNEYSIEIPKASSFKGRGPSFALYFMQHLNTTVFDGTDFVLQTIKYQQEPEEQAQDE